MDRINWEEGRHRVVLIAIADNAEAKRESFCKDVSEKYGIAVPLLKKIIDRCPIILKKNLSLKKAEALAKVLRSFGAVVSVEEKRDLPAISLEFQELSPHRLALESSFLQRTQNFDRYRGMDSMGDLRIQSFANTAFPQNPMKIEEPMTSVGMEEEEGGHCFPTRPRCATCIFETFCPKLYLHVNPSEKGMRE